MSFSQPKQISKGNSSTGSNIGQVQLPLGTPSSSRKLSTARLLSTPTKKSSIHLSPSNTSLHSNSYNNHDGSLLDNEIIPDFSVNVKDPHLMNEVHKHLVSEDTGLNLPGGDMTRDLYKYTINHSPLHNNGSASSNNIIGGSPVVMETDSGNSSIKSGNKGLRRSSSFSFSERRGSSASGINVPGGFRREFIVKKTKKLSSDEDTTDSTGINLASSTELFLARNFMEFLSIYGHFAGESLEDDDFKTCDLNTNLMLKPYDEESLPLLGETSGDNSRRSSLQFYGVHGSNVASQVNGSSRNVTAVKPKRSVEKRTATPMKAYFLLLKSFVGSGILFLPKGFLNGGLLFSAVILLFFAVYSYWCYYLLIKTKDVIQVSSFGDMGMKLFGRKMKFLIIFSIIISQLGFVATYLVFTATNLQAFLRNMLNADAGIGILILFQVMIFMPLSLVRNITKLSLSSLVANFFIIFGLIMIIYYSLIDFIKQKGVASDVKFFNSDWSVFIGVAIFAFEGIGLIIPIQESMIEPKKFPKVLMSVIATVTVLMLIVGILCYSTYGSNVNTVIILNLPQDSIFVNLIQLLYSLAILLSAPLQLFPVIKIVENKIFGKNFSGGKTSLKIKWSKNILRMGSVAGCAVIAFYGSNNLDKFVSFIGCFACIPLVYMYPPLLHYKALGNNSKFDIFLTIFGGVSMVYIMFQLLSS